MKIEQCVDAIFAAATQAQTVHIGRQVFKPLAVRATEPVQRIIPSLNAVPDSLAPANELAAIAHTQRQCLTDRMFVHTGTAKTARQHLPADDANPGSTPGG